MQSIGSHWFFLQMFSRKYESDFFCDLSCLAIVMALDFRKDLTYSRTLWSSPSSWQTSSDHVLVWTPVRR